MGTILFRLRIATQPPLNSATPLMCPSTTLILILSHRGFHRYNDACLEAILSHLNPVQREAVSSPDGPLLILAGAGSGKTRVLTHRIAWLLSDRGVAPQSIAGVTFTNKAAEEVRGRLQQLIGPRSQALWLHTFHALGARLLREYGSALKLPSDFVILDEEDSLALVKGELKALGRGNDVPGGANAVWNAISRAKSSGLSVQACHEQALSASEELTAQVFERYEQAKERAVSVDFDDLILLPTRLLTEHPQVTAQVHERVRHVLVDEYQDTSPAQYRFLCAFTGPERNLTCVGDPDQSIYRWRGADIRNIMEFEQDFPEARVITMEQNYRSTGRILQAASALIAHNQARRPKGLWTEGEPGPPLAVYQALDETDEARFVASCLQRWLENGSGAKDFAVLYRTHAQSRVLEEALSLRRLPYAVIGGVKFYARREVKDVLAYLRLLLNPADTISLTRALGAPPRGVGGASLAKLHRAAEGAGCPVLEVLAGDEFQALLPSRARPAVRDFLGLLNRMANQKAERGYTAALMVALEESGYLAWLDQREGGLSVDRRDNLRELLNAVKTAEKSGASLSEFLERAALLADIDRWRESEELVTLMSLHNAKGLEFKHVFICGLEEGLLPHASSLHDQDELEEERRLFYVGLTRARETVVLSTARGRQQYDRFQWVQASRFLGELPEEIMMHVEGPEALPICLVGAETGDP